MTSSSNRRAQLRAAQAAQARKDRNKKIGITTAVVIVVAALIIAGLVWAGQRGTPSEDMVTPTNANADGTGHLVNPDASDETVVEVFYDYQCPACGALERSTGSEIEGGAERGDYQLIYRPMNFMEANAGNDMSTKAANAAACYAEVGDFTDYHLEIFNNQPQQQGDAGYSDGLLREEIPATLELSGDELTTFQACYDDQKYAEWVSFSNDAASRAGVSATPTVLVNGNEMDRTAMTNPAQWMQFVEATA